VEQAWCGGLSEAIAINGVRAPGSKRCEPRNRRVETSSVSLCRRWRRTFWTLFM